MPPLRSITPRPDVDLPFRPTHSWASIESRLSAPDLRVPGQSNDGQTQVVLQHDAGNIIDRRVLIIEIIDLILPRLSLIAAYHRDDMPVEGSIRQEGLFDLDLR